MKKADIKRLLRQFIENRETFIGMCEKPDWRIFATTPHFWIHWAAANVPNGELAAVSQFVMRDRSGEFRSIADTIAAVYADPLKWVGEPDVADGADYSLRAVMARAGAPG